MDERYREEFEGLIKRENDAECAKSGGILTPNYNILLARNYDGTYFMSKIQERWVTWCAAIRFMNERVRS